MQRVSPVIPKGQLRPPEPRRAPADLLQPKPGQSTQRGGTGRPGGDALRPQNQGDASSGERCSGLGWGVPGQLPCPLPGSPNN